ncbi:MAG: hypothetical protein HQ578_05570, partial [Chloroflexi bacterium]|nr:hypothetical protein [Chloroflexota bacterium]
EEQARIEAEERRKAEEERRMAEAKAKAEADAEAQAKADAEQKAKAEEAKIEAEKEAKAKEEREAGESLPPWVPAAAGAAAGATAATGALLMMAASGVRPKEIWDGMKDLMSQGPASEPEVVEEYPTEEEYEEPEPEHDEPEPEGFWPEEQHRDGQANEYGEVWSEMDGGWVSRRHYDYWRGEARAEVEHAARVNEEMKHRQSSYVKDAYDTVLEEEQKLHDMYVEHYKNQIARKRDQVAYLEEMSSRGYSDAQVVDKFFKSVDKDFQQWGEGLYETYETVHHVVSHPMESAHAVAAKVHEVGAKATEIGADVVRAGADTITELVTHPIESATKVADFYYDTGTKATELTVNGMKKAYKDPWGTAEGAWEGTKKVGKVLLSPLTDIVDENKTLGQRLTSVGLLLYDVASSGSRKGASLGLEAVDNIMDTKGAIKAGGSLDDVVDAGKIVHADARVQTAKMTGDIVQKKTSMIKELDVLAKSNVDDRTKQAMLAQIKQQDSATFNLVRKEALHPDIAKEVNRLTEDFNKNVLNKMSRELTEEGYQVDRVKLGGKTDGADLDSEWFLKKNGKPVSDKKTRVVADRARERVFKKGYEDFNVTPDDVGHKTINDNLNEKFAAKPAQLSITETTFKARPNGSLDFDNPIVKGKSTHQPWEVPASQTISDDACHREFVDSVGNVLKTKTDDMAAKGASATHHDYMNMGREIHKTHNRTVQPLADKIGHEMSPEYKGLMKKLAAVEQTRDVTNLPPLDRIEHIIDNEIRQISTKLPTKTELLKGK